MSRWKAALIHFGLSVLIAGGVLFLMLVIWYPPPYYSVSRAETLILLIIGIDLVLGPLLTLIVFDARKKWLKLDLAIIALLQTAALVYGLHQIYTSRPVFLVAERDFITAVYAYSVDHTPAPNAHFTELPKWGPELVGLQIPNDPQTRSRLIELMMDGKGSMRERLSAYVPFEQVQAELLEHSKPATELTGELDFDGKSPDQLRYVPIYCRSGTLLMILDAATGAPLGAIPDSRPNL
jgi:hypothetical protein